MEKKVSLKDIAGRLNVSVALVSYVLNGKEKEARVGAEIAARIRAVAEELHYQPNLIAKSLKSGKTNTIALIVADISNPFFSGIARIVEDEAKKSGHVVIFGSSDESAEKQQDLITVFLNRQVDAFIVAPTTGTESQIRALKDSGVPVILIDRYFPDIDVDCVRIDNYQAAYKAAQLLIRNGHQKIGMVAYDTTLAHMQERKDGYKAALKENKIRFRKEWLLEVSYATIEKDVHEGLGKLLRPLQVDAMLFATNSLAVAGLKKIIDSGIRIPDELAIISFDQSEVFDFFYSPVSYVSQSLEDIGREAVKLAIRKRTGGKMKSANIVVEAKLVVKESSGKIEPGAG